jgi:hypothetical protein
VFAVVFGVMAHQAGGEANKQRDEANIQQEQALSGIAWIIERLPNYLNVHTISTEGARELLQDAQAKLYSSGLA